MCLAFLLFRIPNSHPKGPASDCETCYADLMKTVTVRDLRQKWPEMEKALQIEREIVITRDSKPVAKLVRYSESTKARKRFDPAAHIQWQRRTSRGKITRWVDEGLRNERDER